MLRARRIVLGWASAIPAVALLFLNLGGIVPIWSWGLFAVALGIISALLALHLIVRERPSVERFRKVGILVGSSAGTIAIGTMFLLLQFPIGLSPEQQSTLMITMLAAGIVVYGIGNIWYRCALRRYEQFPQSDADFAEDAEGNPERPTGEPH
jgi:predicted membrane channel-forming protein YqfA (hemolysin III family)